jgi:hypothetical protein
MNQSTRIIKAKSARLNGRIRSERDAALVKRTRDLIQGSSRGDKKRKELEEEVHRLLSA